MYTKELIDEVKRLFPNSPEMIKHAESGSELLGRHLCDRIETSIPINDVLSATSLDELQEKARLYDQQVVLYAKCHEQDPRRKQ